MPKIDFTKEYDVIVAGGGIAGIAAAVAAAECGATTALIEKTVIPGGLAVNGLIYYFLPLCDGMGTQVSFSLAERLLHASIKYGPSSLSSDWGKEPGKISKERYTTIFAPAAFCLSLDEILEKNSVEVWLDTLVTGVQMGNGIATALDVHNKGGHGRLSAKVFIDATGDAELVRSTGGNYYEGNNALAFWGLEYSESTPLPERRTIRGPLQGVLHGMLEDNEDPKMTDIPGKRRALTPRETTKFILDSRKKIRKEYRGTGREHFPVHLPGMAQFRKSARIVGRSTITSNSFNSRYEDSIGMVADWSACGVIQEIPYSACLPEDASGIIVCGRCISASGYGWELIRSIPGCAVSGEAAGVAAALCVANNALPQKLPVDLLQNELRHRSVRLHLDEIGKLCKSDTGYIPPKIQFFGH